MDDGLKQRLIGAIVLVAIAVLFVPSLFEKNSQRTVDLNTQIPPRPDVVTEILELPEPIRPVNIASSSEIGPLIEVEGEQGQGRVIVDEGFQNIGQADTVISNAEQVVATQVAGSKPSDVADENNSTSSASVLDEDGVPVSWSIQVASFRSKTRALALIDKLQADGHPSYQREARGSQGPLYRVYVGPKINKQHILQAKVQIDKKYNTSAIVLEFKN